MRFATPIEKVHQLIAAGGWVQVCRENAEALLSSPHVEVQCRGPVLRPWVPLEPGYQYQRGMKFRARTTP